MNLSTFIQADLHDAVYRKTDWNWIYHYVNLLGTFYFLINRSEKKGVFKSLDHVFPDCTGLRRLKLRRAVLNGITTHYYEKLFNVYAGESHVRTLFKTHANDSGLTDLYRGLHRGRGVLLVTGHFGGVEYMPLYLACKGLPVTIIVKFKTEKLMRASRQRADRYGIRVINAGTGSGVINGLLRDLRDNRVVITQCDELDAWRPSRRRRIRFLDNIVGLDRTIDILVRRSRAAAVFGVMSRQRERRYHLAALSVKRAKTSFPEMANQSPGEIVLHLLERCVYRFPEQWYQWKKLARWITAAPSAGTNEYGAGMADRWHTPALLP